MKDKAIVKKTNEIFDVEKHWIVKKMSITINLPDDLKDILGDQIAQYECDHKDTNPKEHKEGDHYILSNNEYYISDELIVGIDNIRDYKIRLLE